LPRLLTPAGIFASEIGSTQADPVTAILAAVGLPHLETARDLAGLPRCIIARDVAPGPRVSA